MWVIGRSLTGRNRLSGTAIVPIILLFVQSGIGMTNVFHLAPVRVQAPHLFAADAPWILLVLASADFVLESVKEGQPR
jgi:heme A synthase